MFHVGLKASIYHLSSEQPIWLLFTRSPVPEQCIKPHKHTKCYP